MTATSECMEMSSEVVICSKASGDRALVSSILSYRSGASSGKRAARLLRYLTQLPTFQFACDSANIPNARAPRLKFARPQANQGAGLKQGYVVILGVAFR